MTFNPLGYWKSQEHGDMESSRKFWISSRERNFVSHIRRSGASQEFNSYAFSAFNWPCKCMESHIAMFIDGAWDEFLEGSNGTHLQSGWQYGDLLTSQVDAYDVEFNCGLSTNSVIDFSRVENIHSLSTSSISKQLQLALWRAHRSRKCVAFLSEGLAAIEWVVNARGL